jgi:hypothetical protein
VSDARIKDIKEAILAKLQTISVAGGYNTNIGQTGLSLVWPENIVGSGPAAFVWTARAERAGANLGSGSRARRMTAVITVTGWTQGVLAVEQTDNFLFDIVRAVEQDPTLGLSYVEGCFLSAFADMVTTDDIASPFGRVDAEFTVNYTTAQREV